MKFHRIFIVAVFCFLGWNNLVSSQTVRGRNSGASQTVRNRNSGASQTVRYRNSGASQTVRERNSGASQTVRDRNKGALIGKLTSQKHNVIGDVYAVDENTICIENFHYDGAGQDAYFTVRTSGRPGDPNSRMRVVPNPSPLGRYNGQNLLLKMPRGVKIPKNIKSFSVWSMSQKELFGHVLVPRNLDVPQMRVLPGLTPLKHGVRSGNVTIVNSKTIHISNLFYDGLGPDAFFWVGESATPDYKGIIIPNEKGTKDILTAYDGESIFLQLPNGLTVYDIRYLSVWCREFRVDFGHVLIPNDLWVPPFVQVPRNLDVPQIRVLPGLTPLKHGVRSGNVTIVNSKTIHISNLFYDGLGPDAFFWVGKSATPDYKGIIIPNEKGTKDILTAYNGESISLQLPDGLTVYDISYLSVWCREFRVDFGHVLIPNDLRVPPFEQ